MLRAQISSAITPFSNSSVISRDGTGKKEGDDKDEKKDGDDKDKKDKKKEEKKKELPPVMTLKNPSRVTPQQRKCIKFDTKTTLSESGEVSFFLVFG